MGQEVKESQEKSAKISEETNFRENGGSSSSHPSSKFQLLLHYYKKIVVENKEMTTTIETFLRSMIHFLPGKFRDSELKIEAAYSGISLMSLFHDLILLDHYKKQEGYRFHQVMDMECVPIAKWIAFIQSVELSLEIFFHKFRGEKAAWMISFLLESIKCWLKWKLICLKDGRMVTNFSIPSSTEIERQVSYLHMSTNNQQSRPRKEVSEQKWRNFLLYAKRGDSSLYHSSFSQMLAEIIFVIRPLIYLLSMAQYGRKSWKPWIISIALEFTSFYHHLQRYSILSSKEKQEMTRRMGLFLYYILRTPFFEVAMRNCPVLLKNIFNKVNSLPIVNGISEIIKYYLNLYRKYYFYTAATQISVLFIP